MESTINSRVAALVKSLKMSNNAFAKSIGKTSSTINFIVDGRSKPGFEVLESICETYQTVNPTWLLRGEGEMFIEQTPLLSSNSLPDQYLQDHVKVLEESFKKLALQLEVKDRQLENKDQQLEGLQQTIKVLLGKFRGVIFLTSRNIFLPAEIEAARA